MTVDKALTAKSLLWSGIESGGLAAMSLVSLVLYSHLLSTADFGIFSVVVSLVEVLGIPVGMLFHDALIQRPEINELHYDTAFTTTVILSIIIMLGCQILAPWFALTIHQSEASVILFWLSFSFPISGFSSTILARQRRQFGFKALALRSLLGRVAGAAVGVSSALAGAGLWSLVAQQIAMVAVGTLTLWVKTNEKPHLRFGIREFIDLFRFGIFSITTLFVSFSIKRVFTIIAGASLGVTAAGYLNLSFRVVDIFWVILASSLSQVAGPMLASLQGDRKRLCRAYTSAVALTSLVLYAVFTGIAVTAPEIIDIVFGKAWSPSVPLITALSCLVIAQAPRLFITPILNAVRRPHEPLINGVIQLLFILSIATLSSIPTPARAMGLWITSELITIPLGAWFISRAIGISVIQQYRGAVMPFIAAAIMLLLLTGLHYYVMINWNVWLRFATLVSSGVLIYSGCIYYLDRKLALDCIQFFAKIIGLDVVDRYVS